MRPWIVLMCVLGGCGARTDLERPDGGEPERPDAFFLATFPCRWTLGLELELQDPYEGGDVRGALAGGRGEAVVTWSMPREEDRGVRIALGATPRRVAEWTGPEGAPFTGDDGYLIVSDAAAGAPRPSCRVERVAAEGASLEGATFFDEGDTCVGHQDAAGRLELIARDRVVSVVDLTPTPLPTPLALVLEVVHAPGRGTVTMGCVDGDCSRVAIARDEEIVTELARGEGVLGGALDRVRDAVVVVHGDPDEGAVVSRVRFEGGGLERLVALPSAPIGNMTSNETEVLVPLADGTLAFVPLALERVERTEPFASPPPSHAQIILFPGGSAGGLVYVRDETLAFRTLICNR